MGERLFCYGTLEFPEVMLLIAGQLPRMEPAMLPDYERRRMLDGPWPGIAPAPGRMVQGASADIDAATLRLLDRYEGDAYRRVLLDVRISSGLVPAWVYMPDARLVTRHPWDPESFAREHLREYLADIRREVLSLPFGGAHGFSTGS
jgi:gamma-glutamylcyclotransferase (GGCT)/AIG2-like uncharacterized protein YtfP